MKRLLLQLLAVLLCGMMNAQAPKKPDFQKRLTLPHHVGDKWGGGIVISVDSTGQHGLIVESSDLVGGKWSWYAAVEIMKFECFHSTEGAKFTDWRLPTKDELDKLFINNAAIGGFIKDFYWSSQESLVDIEIAGMQFFFSGQWSIGDKSHKYHVRSVRDF